MVGVCFSFDEKWLAKSMHVGIVYCGNICSYLQVSQLMYIDRTVSIWGNAHSRFNRLEKGTE